MAEAAQPKDTETRTLVATALQVSQRKWASRSIREVEEADLICRLVAKVHELEARVEEQGTYLVTIQLAAA
jgi:4-hydroxy-3-methylbut-2-enyl diphosphate reductase IspH